MGYRVTEKILQERVNTLAQRYPESDLQLQWRGVGWGVWANKPGKWLIEGMATNSDLADAISGAWEVANLERNQVRREIVADLQYIMDEHKADVANKRLDDLARYALLVSNVDTLLKKHRALLP